MLAERKGEVKADTVFDTDGNVETYYCSILYKGNSSAAIDTKQHNNRC